MATQTGEPTDHACGRCAKRALKYVASLPKGPEHPQHHEIWVCEGCGNVQWIAAQLSKSR